MSEGLPRGTRILRTYISRGRPFRRISPGRSRAGRRSPAVRTVDRLISANLRRLRMNGLRPGYCDDRTVVYQNRRCRLPPKGRIGNSALSILGRFAGNSYTGTCRKSSGAGRCSVAGQRHWFQQLEVHKPLIRWRMPKPIHCAQGIETPNSSFWLIPLVSFDWACIIYTPRSAS
jgi:hypothetical protein